MNIHTRKVVVLGVVVGAVLVAGVLLPGSIQFRGTTTDAADGDCNLNDFEVATVSRDGTATVDLRPGAAVPCNVYLASYERNNPDTLQNQELFAEYRGGAGFTINNRQPHSFSVALPNCHYQVDLSIERITRATDYRTTNLLDAAFSGDNRDRFCNEAAPTPTPSRTPNPTGTPVPPPTADIRANGSDGPITIPRGDNARITWTSTNATTCLVTPGNFTGLFGGQIVGPITTMTTYSIVCNGPGGSAADSVTINVVAGTPTPTPSGTVTPTPTPTPTPTGTPTPVALIAGDGVFPCPGPTGTPVQVRLSWTAFPLDVNFYEIQRSPNSGGPFATIATNVRATFYHDPPVAPGTFYYRVIAHLANGNSITSNVASATFFPQPCPTPSPTPTPTPTPALTCSPAFQTVNAGQTASFSASGGVGGYTWQSPSGNPVSGSGTSYSTVYPTSGTDQIYTVILRSGGDFAICSVRVLATAPVNANIGISKTVRNVTTNSGEFESLTVNPSETLEFILRVSSVGTVTATNVRVSDTLPSGLTYVNGSSRVDGAIWSDGITSGGISLGDMAPGRTVTVRFQATVAPASSFPIGTTTLSNVALSTSNNASSVSDTATVVVNRTNPVVIPGVVSIQKFGRNVTIGESGEFTSVRVRGNDVVEFIIRVRNLSTQTMTNVIVSDVLPAGVTYVPNTTTIDGRSVQEGITTSGGIVVGSLAPNQEVIIRFQGRINSGNSFPSGATTAVNIANVRADNVPTASAQLPLQFGTSTVISRVSGIQTGAAGSAMLALLVSGLLTYGYARYTRTNIFLKRDAGAAVRHSLADKQRLNFARFL